MLSRDISRAAMKAPMSSVLSPLGAASRRAILFRPANSAWMRDMISWMLNRMGAMFMTSCLVLTRMAAMASSRGPRVLRETSRSS
ncbi:MAG: hypothetical protein BWZ01_02895 [Deltaproteobacteria bacterium ADurb.BinA179]|nr:MAG: hypothetical protein BWZ01_02895 [Deltaproteobacteria bacterium ADurb.BinA179]